MLKSVATRMAQGLEPMAFLGAAVLMRSGPRPGPRPAGSSRLFLDFGVADQPIFIAGHARNAGAISLAAAVWQGRSLGGAAGQDAHPLLELEQAELDALAGRGWLELLEFVLERIADQ